jgi:ABC-2 type transport system ATP-binding protein
VSGLSLERVWSETLQGVSLELEVGTVVVIGEASDGTAALAELCAGVRAPRRGRVRLGSAAPSASPELRRSIASLLADESNAGAGDVRSWAQAVAARSGFSAEAGLGGLRFPLERKLASLSNAERRELACVVALAHPAPALLVLHDPFSACAPGARQALLRRLAELAGTCPVLVTTPSFEDARQLGGATFFLDRGLLSQVPRGSLPGALTPGLDVWLCVEASDPRALASALAPHPDVRELDFDESRGGRLLLRGVDLERLCVAVAQAAVGARVDIHLLRALAEDLATARAAATGTAHAAYAAARQRARGQT